MKCEYGCNQEAKFQTKSGKWCCSESPNSCTENKRKNSEGCTKAFKEGRKNCDHWNIDGRRNWSKNKTILSDDRIKSKHNIDNIFIQESTVRVNRIRGLILKEKLIEYKCAECGLTSWNNKLITLELHHKNGIRNDMRLENLDFLCPNCHSQTENFCGKNIGRQKIEEEIFLKALKENKSIHSTLISLGLAPKGGNYFRARELIDKYEIKM